MSMNKALIRFMAEGKQLKSLVAEKPDSSSLDRTSLNTFINNVEPLFYSSGTDTGARVMDSTLYDVVSRGVAMPANPSLGAKRMITVLKDEYGRAHKYQIPVLVDGNLQSDGEGGQEATSAVKLALASAYGAMLGYSFTCEKCYVYQPEG